MRLVDLAGEAIAGVVARPSRAVLTVLGTVAGVGAFVATLGLTSTAGAQISERFDALAATEVVVEDGTGADGATSTDPAALAYPGDWPDRVDRLPGVEAAGLMWQADVPGGVRSRWADRASTLDVPVFAVSPSTFGVIEPQVRRGRLFDGFAAGRSEPVAVLSESVASQLGVTDVDRQPTVFLGDRPFTVLGIVDDVLRHPEVLLGVMVPDTTALDEFGTAATGPHRLVVATRPGAAQVVASQAAVALRPDRPELLRAVAPPDPEDLRNQVDEDVTSLFLLLAAVSLVIGAFGIANTTLVAVLERVPEIGLRRALGAGRRHIAGQFLAETATLGTIGGVVGTSVGVITVVAVSVARHWTPTIEPLAVLPAPLLGTVIGLLAGLYPSLRAAAIPPTLALRR